MKYVAMQLIWHSKNHRYYQPGESIPLNHLDQASIQRLIDMKVVIEADAAQRLEAVSGIGSEWAKALHTIGIFTPEQLVEQTPDEVEQKLGVASLGQVRRWQESARLLLAAGSQPEQAANTQPDTRLGTRKQVKGGLDGTHNTVGAANHE